MRRCRAGGAAEPDRRGLSRYGGDAAVLGRTVTIDGAPVDHWSASCRIASGFPGTAAIWLPLRQAPGLAARGPRRANAAGLRPASRTSARVGDADRRSRRHRATDWRRSTRTPTGNMRARAVPINDRFLGSPTDPVWRRLHDRRLHRRADLLRQRRQPDARSIAAARARAGDSRVGGRQPRPARPQQLLAEGAAIAASRRGASGCSSAIAGVRVFRSAIPGDALPYWFDYSVDWRVLAALIGVSVADRAGLRIAARPFRPRRRDVIAVLKDGGRSSTASRRHMWSTAFLAAQVALCVVLLAHFAVAVRADGPGPAVGRDTSTRPTIVTATLTLPPANYPTHAERVGFYDALMRRVRGVKAIEAAAFASTLPFTNGESKPLVIDGRARPTTARPLQHWSSRSRPDTSLPSGCRSFRAASSMTSDGGPGRENVIVNESFVQEFFPGGGALGRRIAIGDAVPDGWRNRAVADHRRYLADRFDSVAARIRNRSSSCRGPQARPPPVH